ncbi:frizzled-4 [Neodiprion virginianus]|uniref:frizzled-4 n=1 Tax=Neodiprion virginianus TaxID=2961670 RepID=UPI001EE76E8E|nr:frizzled-4 [Neodiprion virginianus]
MSRLILHLFLIVNMFGKIFTTHGVCEPIRIEMCRGVGYNVTAMPNLVGNEIQGEADFTLQTFNPLIQYGCSAQLHLFLCSVYAPMCTEKVPSPIGPCRGLCEQVRARCYPVLLGFGFPWPAALNCSKFPPENNHQHMCMEGPGEPGPANPFQAVGDGNGPLGCSWYAKAGLYVFLNRSGRCAATCDADVLWSQKDKRLTEAWIAASATVCLISVAAAILALIKPRKHRATTSVERAIACLAVCHAVVAVGHVVRLAAGRFAVACTPALPLHPQEPVVIAQQHHQYLTQDGLSNPYCALVFLLRYYFGNAAIVWWVVVCGWWCIAARKWSRSDASGGSGVGVGVVQGKKYYGSHWSCFVGQQSTRSLLVLVLGPQLAYLFFGLSFLIVGSATLLLPRPSVRLSPLLSPLNPSPTTASSTHSNTRSQLHQQHHTLHGQQSRGVQNSVQNVFQGKTGQPSCATILQADPRAHQRALLTRVGVFACGYAAIVLAVAGINFYEWLSRDSWLRAPEPSTAPKEAPRPMIQMFVMRSVASLLAGIIAAAWIWWPNLLGVWRRLPPCKQPPHKCHPAPVVRCYSTGSTSPTPHQIHHLSHLAPQHPLLMRNAPVVNNGQVPAPYRGHKKHRKHRKHHSGSETQV